MQATLAMDIDPATGQADLVFAGGTLALDATPRTPAIVSLLCDRRARPDDQLPLIEAPTLQPDLLDPRRGWWGDALDAAGRRIGCRWWLLSRAKATETARRLVEHYGREALAWAVPLGLTVAASWVQPGWIRCDMRIGRAAVVVERQIV